MLQHSRDQDQLVCLNLAVMPRNSEPWLDDGVELVSHATRIEKRAKHYCESVIKLYKSYFIFI